MSKNIKVILGSIRTGRAGKKIADWVIKASKEYKGDIDFELIDLKEINLPFLDEPASPMSSDNYVHQHTIKWSNIIKDSDGFIFVTPEYNHGYSPVLKNAIDFLYKEWQGKSVGFVGYGGSGARDSIRQLKEVVTFIGMKPIEEQIGIGHIWESIDENGNVKSEYIRGDIHNLFKQLEIV